MAPKQKRLLKKDEIVKSLKGFVADEDGFVSKETILKVGLSTVAGLATLGMATDAAARKPDHANHANRIESHDDNCFRHTNDVTHNSY